LLGTGNLFWTYAFICALGFVFVRRFVPETKGQSLEQIEAAVTQEASPLKSTKNVKKKETVF